MVDNMTLTGRFSMLNAEADLTYDLGDIYDMRGDQHERLPGAQGVVRITYTVLGTERTRTTRLLRCRKTWMRNNRTTRRGKEPPPYQQEEEDR